MNYPQQQSYQVSDAQMAGQSAGNQPPDLIAMLWRWKWLPILGTLIGAAVGFLVWIQLPPQFMALARIQVVTPGSQGIPMAQLDYVENRQGNRGDDVMIIQSSIVIRNAIEIGRLGSNPKLSDKSSDELIGWIRNKYRLTVRPGTKEAATNLVDVLFRCDDAELSAEVVGALINGYEKFIGREAQMLSSEVLEKLARFRDDYDVRARTARENYLKLTRATPLIRDGDGFKDPDTVALLATIQQVGEINTKIGSFASAIETAETSANREGGKNIEAILTFLSRVTHDPTFLKQDLLAEEQRRQSFLSTDAPSSMYRLNSLEPLQDEYRALESNLGDGHPALTRLRFRIEGMKARIQEMEIAEAEERKKKEALLSGINSETRDPALLLSIVLGSMNEQLMSLQREKDQLMKQASELAAKSKEQQYAIVELEVLKQEMDSINQSAEELKTALNRLNMGTGSGTKVMKRLEVPSLGYADGPYLWKYLALSAFIGAGLFTCLAYLLELADRSYRGPDEIARDLGVPILGHIQMSNLTRKDRKDEKIDLSMVTFHKAKSTASEAFRGVRTAVYFGNQAGSIKVIQITSPVPGDGKSTVAANLAFSIAQSGRRTLLMDCDMRRPRLAKLIGVRDDLGLTNVLAGKATLEEAIQATVADHMDILTCGRRPGNPAELLLSDDFVDVVNALRERYDYIIVDTPPILAVSDPANASACSDGVILTLRLRRNLRPIAIRAAQMLQSVNANLLGVVINGVTGRAGYGYGGYRYDGSRTSAGYGGYGYGATYGYGDYYSSSMAESIVASPSTRPFPANGQAPVANGQAISNKGPASPGNGNV